MLRERERERQIDKCTFIRKLAARGKFTGFGAVLSMKDPSADELRTSCYAIQYQVIQYMLSYIYIYTHTHTIILHYIIIYIYIYICYCIIVQYMCCIVLQQFIYYYTIALYIIKYGSITLCCIMLYVVSLAQRHKQHVQSSHKRHHTQLYIKYTQKHTTK